MENPEGMSLTWNPRLVKTPTPIMSATTMAVATVTETVEAEPGSLPDVAASPVSDAAMSGSNLSSSRLQTVSIDSTSVNKELPRAQFRYQITLHLTGQQWRPPNTPHSRHDS